MDGLFRTDIAALVEKGALLTAFTLDAVTISACVQFGLALPMIEYFHRLSITGLSANIVIVPLLSLVVPLGFACILTGSRWLASITAALLKLAGMVATWHACLEPSWRVAALPLWLSILFSVSLVLLAISVRRNRSLFIAPCLFCSLFLFGVLYYQPWPPDVRRGMLEVTAVDVSQG